MSDWHKFLLLPSLLSEFKYIHSQYFFFFDSFEYLIDSFYKTIHEKILVSKGYETKLLKSNFDIKFIIYNKKYYSFN